MAGAVDPAVPAGVAWAVCVRDVGAGGRVVRAVDADVVMPVASVGKVVLLVEVARQLEAGELGRGEVLDRGAVAPVGDSGLWQHLAVEALPVADVAALVGAVSDNLATNVLLERVGLEAVAECGRAIGLERTALHDRVRDDRGAGDPPALSTGTAGELSRLFADLERGAVLSRRVSAQVLGWLAAGADLSMVAAAFDLDPLAHVDPDRGLRLRNKTGTDAGVRADAGVLAGPARTLSYAVLASWPSGPEHVDHRGAVLTAMRRLGEQVIRECTASAQDGCSRSHAT